MAPMDIITFPPQEASEVFDDVQRPWASGIERGGGDTAGSPTEEAGVVTPRLAHHYSDGVVIPGLCAWCGQPLHKHEGR
jgi:hypothetical protein